MQKWIMSGILIVACAFAAVLMFTLPGKDQVAQEEKPQMPAVTVSAEQAEATVKANCISCHGTDLQGGAGPNLQKIGSELSAEQLYGIITKGKGGGMMPSFKDKLKDEEIANVAMWLAEKK
ncbi:MULTISPECIES: c-type cytochrome [Paenibacillus]|uniref:Cytochrome c n=1 Tax=Paenibacillus vini TaxID=1476024 RepID=A0ABQ4MIY3_9BACL|nr:MULTISPECIES: cytochrome c [Paenibacillus]MBQ4901261.1 cytochrome c [Paenibacillus sp. Marseille-P2973]MDN4070795.1 cytochrome c [Paenibacillus vini]GIP55602.1 cytochrome c [Paenibacillus vini]